MEFTVIVGTAKTMNSVLFALAISLGSACSDPSTEAIIEDQPEIDRNLDSFIPRERPNVDGVLVELNGGAFLGVLDVEAPTGHDVLYAETMMLQRAGPQPAVGPRVDATSQVLKIQCSTGAVRVVGNVDYRANGELVRFWPVEASDSRQASMLEVSRIICDGSYRERGWRRFTSISEFLELFDELP
jgi:hypothetical protein